MRAETRTRIEQALGDRVQGAQPVSGGDINEAWEVELSTGRRVFVKLNARAPAGMFEAEAHGLDWLRAGGALRVPRVLAFGDAPHAFIALEHLGRGSPRRGFDDELGRGLALLHRSGAPSFGLERDNFIGSLPQDNRPAPSWPELYRERRLRPHVDRAARAGLLSAALVRRFDGLFAKLEDLVGPTEPAARLHGDLWGGNLHVDDDGAPCLIDPAVYGGHREVDLAMMRLFGGFGARVFAAYAEAWPLAPGHAERVSLYQLYPLLVHVNLFGRSYVGQLEHALERYV